jgi:hypothetical protein
VSAPPFTSLSASSVVDPEGAAVPWQLPDPGLDALWPTLPPPAAQVAPPADTVDRTNALANNHLGCMKHALAQFNALAISSFFPSTITNDIGMICVCWLNK